MRLVWGGIVIRNLTLRAHLRIIFLFLSLMPIVILGFIQVRQIYEITTEYDQLQMQLTQRLADEIDSYVKNHRDAVETLADGITSSRERDVRQLTHYLKAFRQNFPGFINLYIADKQGIAIAFYPETNASGQVLIGYDFSDRDYFKQVSSRKATAISSLFQGRGGTSEPIITIAAPIFDSNNDFDGYVLGALELSKVETLATKYAYGQNGYAAVMDSHGKAIYHPDVDTHLSINDLSEESIMKQRARISHGAGKFYSTIAKQEEYTTYTVIPGLEWTVWVSKPSFVHEEEFYRSLRSTGIMLVTVWLVTGTVGWIFTRRLNHSISSLAHYAQALTGVGFEASAIQLEDSKAPRELNVLSKTFQQMAEKIKQNEATLMQLNSELEERVAERIKENDALLRASQEQHASLQAVLESMSDAIVIVDEDGVVTYANRRMAQIFDLPISDLLAANEEEILSLTSGRYKQDQAHLSRLFAGQQSHAILTASNKSQQWQHIAVTSFYVLEKSDEPIGRGYVWRDITKEYEIDQLKNSLISLASHEFKTPLTSIKGSIETLLRSDAQWDAAFQQEMLESALEDVARIQALVDDWLDISRIDAGTLVLRRKRIPVKSLIGSSLDHFSRASHNATIRTVIQPDMPQVYADPDRIEQVLINLFSNAVRYNDRKPQIEIATDFDDNYIYIHIKDNGIGIAAETLESIFERFYQVDSSSTRRSGGTGLGLTISKGIVEAHGGWIRVASTVGLGSIFTIVLPRFSGEGDDDEKRADFYC